MKTYLQSIDYEPDFDDDRPRAQRARTYLQPIDYEPEFPDPNTGGILNAGLSGLKKLGSSLKTGFNVLTGDEQEARESAAQGAQIQSTDKAGRFQKTFQKRTEDSTGWFDTIKDFVGAVVEEPGGAIHSMAEQVPNSLPSLAAMATGAKVGAMTGSLGGPVGTIIGGIIGGIAGMYAGGIVVETGYIAQDELNQAGSEFDRGGILKKGVKKGAVIGTADLIGMAVTGGAGKVLFGPAMRESSKAISVLLRSKGINPLDDMAIKAAVKAEPGLKKMMADVGKQAAKPYLPSKKAVAALLVGSTATEVVTEGGGEYLGNIAAGYEPDIAGAVLEGGMSLGQGAVHTAIGAGGGAALGGIAAKNLLKKDAPKKGDVGQDKGFSGEDLTQAPELGGPQQTQTPAPDPGPDEFQSAMAGAPGDLYADVIPFAGVPNEEEIGWMEEIERQRSMAGRKSPEPIQPEPAQVDPLQAFRMENQTMMDNMASEPDFSITKVGLTQSKNLLAANIDTLKRTKSRERSVAALEQRQQAMGREPEAWDTRQLMTALQGQPDETQLPLPGDMPSFMRGMEPTPEEGKYRPFAGLADMMQKPAVQAQIMTHPDHVDDGLTVSTDARVEPSSERDQRRFQTGLTDHFGMQDLPAEGITAMRPVFEHEVEPAQVNADPTEAQKLAGNYKKDHIRIDGLDISIENPDGSTRKGRDKSGKEWQSTMHGHYGYFRRTKGKDGDQVDVIIKPGTESSPKVFVVDQVDPESGQFDKHKVILGVGTEQEARDLYLSNYEAGWKGLGGVTEMDPAGFKEWLKDDAADNTPSASDASAPQGVASAAPESGPITQNAPNFDSSIKQSAIETDAAHQSLSPDTPVSWQNKKGDTLTGTLHSQKGNNHWFVLKPDGKKALVHRNHLTVMGQQAEQAAPSAPQKVADPIVQALEKARAELPEGYSIQKERGDDGKPSISLMENGRYAVNGLNFTEGGIAEAVRLANVRFEKSGKKQQSEQPSDQTPDLSVSGRQKDLPGQPDLAYTVHKDRDGGFKVTIAHKSNSSVIPIYGKGDTAEAAYKRAVALLKKEFRPPEPTEPTKQEQAEPTPKPSTVGMSPELAYRTEYQYWIENGRKGEPPSVPSYMPSHVIQSIQDSAKRAAEPAQTEQAPHITLDTKQKEAAINFFAQKLHDGETVFKTITDARVALRDHQIMEVQAGTPEAKMVDEAMEVAGVLVARSIVSNGKKGGWSATRIFDALVQLQSRMPKLAVRSSTSTREQAYSTPLPLAWVVSELAGISDSTTVYEPSAGHGALLIGSALNKATVNELNLDRYEVLAGMGYYDTRRGDGTVTVANRRVDVVVANPPFGTVQGKNNKPKTWKITDQYTTTQIDHAMVFQALKSMKADGRAVLIVGSVNDKNPSDDARKLQYRLAAKVNFFKHLFDHYNVVDLFTVSGKLYEKQGAGWPVDVIVIDGAGKSAMRLPGAQPPPYISTIDELKGKLDGQTSTELDRVGTQDTRPGAVSDGNLDSAGNQTDQTGVREPLGGSDSGDVRSGGGEGERPGISGRKDGRPGDQDGRVDGSQSQDGGVRPDRPMGQHPDERPPGLVEPVRPAAGKSGEQNRPGSGRPADGPRLVDVGGQPRLPVRIDQELANTSEADLDAMLDEAFGEDLTVPKDISAELQGMSESQIDDLIDEVFAPTPDPHTKQPTRKTSTPKQDLGRRSKDVGLQASRAQNEATVEKYLKDWARREARKNNPPKLPPKRPPKDAKDHLKDVALESLQGVKDAVAGLSALFSPRNTLSSGFVFNEDTYQAAKPYFVSAWDHAKAAGHSLKQLIQHLAGQFGAEIKPYLKRFFVEQAAAEQNQPKDEGKKQDEVKAPADKTQVVYQPASQSSAIGTLMPANLAAPMKQALSNLQDEHGDIDQFVADRLGYTLQEALQYFSAEQIDAIALALDNIAKGNGFIIGDQTGVGKGRTVAAMIRYGIKHGITPIFVTDKPNLYTDMYRDLSDIGMADIADRILITNAKENILLTPDGSKRIKTKSTHNAVLREMTRNGDLYITNRDLTTTSYDVVFTTYDQLNGTDNPRRRFLETIGRGGMFILDEAHKAGGSQNTRPQAGKEPRSEWMRRMLHDAHSVFYSSATYAKRPDVMTLYHRTDMRLAVDDIEALAPAIERGGIPLQQAVAAMLTEAGQHVRRERSFDGVSYDTQEVEIDMAAATRMSETFAEIKGFSDDYVGPAVTGIADTGAEGGVGVVDGSAASEAQISTTGFTSIMHNLISQTLLAMKTPAGVDLAIEQYKAGKKPVLTLANTMGSFIQSYAEEHGLRPGDGIALSFNDLLFNYLQKTRRYTEKPPGGGQATVHWVSDEELGPAGVREYERIREFIYSLDFTNVPVSPVDYALAKFKEAGIPAGEITGREHTIEYRPDGSQIYRKRSTGDKDAAARTKLLHAFNTDRVNALVLNQSGSTGLSAHAIPKYEGHQPAERVMIILQAEANIDTHMQMLGRVHRAGQVIPPSYIQLSGNIPSEKRPAAVLAGKMASLNANTTAAKTGKLEAEGVLDFINKYGNRVVANIMGNFPEIHEALGEPLATDSSTESGFKEDGAARKVTGRIPLLRSIQEQETLYNLIESEYTSMIAMLDATGMNDLEAKTFDTDARTIRKAVIRPGDPRSPFTAEAVAESVDMKKLGRAYTKNEVITLLKQEALGIDATEAKRTDADLDDIVDKLETAHDTQARKVLADFNGYLAEATEDLPSPERVAATETRLTTTREEWETVYWKATPGTIWQFPIGDTYYNCVVLGVEQKGKPKNPVALGTWVVKLAVPDSARRVDITFSAILKMTRTEHEILQGANDRVTESRLTIFDRASSTARETRTILTGNLLAAFGLYPRGRIINFTNQKGEIRQGILMPADFNLEGEARNQRVRLKTVEAAMQVLQNGYGIRSKGDLVINVNNGVFRMSVPASRQRGAVFFQNEALLSAIGSDFVKSGNRMMVTVPPTRLQSVLEIATSRTGLAQSFTNIDPNDNSRIRELLGIEEIRWEEAGTESHIEDQPRGQGEAKLSTSDDAKGPDAFVTNEQGSVDFGQVSTQVAQAIGRQSGKIHLQEGDDTFGKIHIEKSHLAEFQKNGYETVESFVSDVASHYSEIRKGGSGSLILVKKNGGNKIAYIELKPGGQGRDFYTVKSATFAGTQYVENKELLWEGAPSLHSITGTPNAISGKSNSDNKIPTESDSVKGQFQADTTPGMGISIKDIQKRFKGQQVFLTKENKIAVRLKGGQGFVIEQVKAFESGDTQLAMRLGRMGSTGMILGKYKNRTITLNRDYATKGTLDHELYHFLVDIGLISKLERAAIRGKANAYKKAGTFKYEWRESMEENEANALSQLLEERESHRGTLLGAVLQRIADFLDALAHIGRTSARKVARSVESGKMFERRGEKGTGGAAMFSQAAPVDSPAFKDWFGRSIATDRTGKPVVFLHGTPEQFTVFDADRAGKSTGHASSGLGNFFTMSPRKADRYSQGTGNIMQVYLKMERPYKMSLKEIQSLETVDQARQRKAELKAQGYDSVIVPKSQTGDIEPIVIVFDSNHVKSIHNRGTWDKNNPDVRFTFAGPEAATADKSKAFEAQQMRDEGASRKEVWDKTGWWEIIPGSDVWSFELDDSKVQLAGLEKKLQGYTDGGTVYSTIGEAVKADELFSAYPWLKDIDLAITVKKDAGPSGLHQPPVDRSHENLFDLQQEIKVSAPDIETARAILIHEIQHAIQVHEGFDPGGNPNQFDRNPEAQRDAEALETLRYLRSNPDKSLELVAEEMEAVGKPVPTIEHLRWLRDEADEKSMAGRAAKARDPYDQYRTLTGEAEARLVQKRLRMTADQRKAEAPWITLKGMMWEEGLLTDLNQNPEDVLITLNGPGNNISYSKEAGYDDAEIRNELQDPDSIPSDVKFSTSDDVITEKFGTDTTTGRRVADLFGKAKSKENRADALDRLITQTLDNLHPIKQKLGDVPYKMHRMLTGVKSATFSMFLEHGPLSWDGNTLTVKDRNKGVLPFLRSIGPDWQNLLYWVAAKRAEQLEMEGRENWLDKDARDQIFARVGTHSRNGKSWAALNLKLQSINKNVLDIAEQAGLIDPESRKEWESNFYVPFYRLLEDEVTQQEFLSGPRRSKQHISAQIRQLKGGSAKIGDPMENLLKNWMHIIDASARNKARESAFDVGLKVGVLEAVDKTDLLRVLGSEAVTRWAVIREGASRARNVFDTQEEAEAWAYHLEDDGKGPYQVERRKEYKVVFGRMKDFGILSFQQNGEPVYFKTLDEDLYNALAEVDIKAFNNVLMKLMGTAKRWLSYGATFGPAFRVRNMIRDTVHTAVVAKSFMPFVDTARGFVKSMREDADYIEYMASGFGFGSSYVHTDDPGSTARFIKRIIRNEGRGAADRILDTPRKMLGIWDKIGAASENATRLGLYTNLKRKGMNTFDAGFEARDLMDFSMRGAAQTVQTLTRIVPFLNARIQGLYKLGRAAHDNPGAFALKSALLTTAALALWSLFKDDDRYKDLPDWDKWTYFHFWLGEDHYRIPKPFEIGALFCSLPESVANVMNETEEGRHVWDWFTFTAMDVFHVGLPQLFQPVIEERFNVDTFRGGKIVPDSMRHLIAEEQYTSRTSDTMKLLGKALGVSPIKLEHYVTGYFSTLGAMVLFPIDIITRHAVGAPEKPTGGFNPYHLSMVNRKTGDKYVDRFYDLYDEVDEAYRTVRHYANTGRLAEARAYASDNRGKLVMRKTTNAVRSHLSDVNEAIKRVQRSRTMTGKEKETAIDALKERRKSVIKALFAKIRDR